MIKVNIHQIKTHFSEYLAKIEKGECIIICRRNIPIAQIHAVSQPSSKSRPIGLAKKTLEISKEFFDPLPKEIIDAFNLKNTKEK